MCRIWNSGGAPIAGAVRCDVVGDVGRDRAGPSGRQSISRSRHRGSNQWTRVGQAARLRPLLTGGEKNVSVLVGTAGVRYS